jgi:hypothetical protein
MNIWKILCALLAFSIPAAAQVTPLTDRQIAAGAAHAVVAVVEEATVRWNEQRTLLFTDYSLRVEDRLKGDAPDRITLSIPGGTLDGQTHGTSVSTHLETGARYLLFLNDLERRLLVPVTGGWQGVFRLGPRGPQIIRSARELIRRVEADPRLEDTEWMQEVETSGLPAKAYDRTPRQAPVAVVPALSATTAAKAPKLRYTVEHPAAPPLVFDPLPADSPFSPADQEMLAYWNLYLKKPLFLVAKDPSSGWGYNNGVSEIAGFPSSQTMIDEFGVGWFGATYGAVLYVYGPDGRTIEIDVALNPARTWILDDTKPTTIGLFSGSGTKYNFKPVVLSLLGTGWGYQGPLDESIDSVVDFPDEFTFATLLAVDAVAVRETFGGKPIRDGLVSPYSIFVSEDGLLNWSYAYPDVETAPAGSTIRFSAPIKIENPGTVKLARSTVEVYLIPRHGSLDGAILLKRIAVAGSLRSGETRKVDLGSATVPASTPAGTYYFAYVLRDPKDAYQANNRAWGLDDVRLTVTR